MTTITNAVKHGEQSSTIINMVKKSANHTNIRHFKSQPMPVSYSRPFQYVIGNPTPNQMQEAFMRAVVKAERVY